MPDFSLKIIHVVMNLVRSLKQVENQSFFPPHTCVCNYIAKSADKMKYFFKIVLFFY